MAGGASPAPLGGGGRGGVMSPAELTKRVMVGGRERWVHTRDVVGWKERALVRQKKSAVFRTAKASEMLTTP